MQNNTFRGTHVTSDRILRPNPRADYSCPRQESLCMASGQQVRQLNASRFYRFTLHICPAWKYNFLHLWQVISRVHACLLQESILFYFILKSRICIKYVFFKKKLTLTWINENVFHKFMKKIVNLFGKSVNFPRFYSTSLINRTGFQ